MGQVGVARAYGIRQLLSKKTGDERPGSVVRVKGEGSRGYGTVFGGGGAAVPPHTYLESTS
jgi:hypothetical protein